MSWEEDLFAVLDDLEQQAQALYDADRTAQLVDRSRAEYHQVTLASRLMASVGLDVAMEVLGAGAVAGTLDRVGSGWCLLRGHPRDRPRDWVVRTEAVSVLRRASDRALPEVAWSPVARLGLGSALRRVADAGEPCLLYLVDGGRHEAVLHRVGADFVEAEVLRGERVLVAFASLAAVQSRG